METRCCCPPESWLGRYAKPLAQAERAEQLLGARIPLCGRHARIDRRHFDILQRGRGSNQVVALENEAERLAPQPRQLVALEAGHVLAHEAVDAGGWPVEAAEDVHERGLARTGSTHDRKELAAVNLQAYPVENFDIQLAAAKGLGHIFELDERLAGKFGSRGRRERPGR